ncbi:FRG domain-containing protein [Bradyrhizobium erythrophlei]|uniref:FRG domain-containing protein n=1 Tax=Bradyrhizobium erythrophlei TaxID=1437360 RepID=A0A1M5YJ39_9BRAD|nr:FRG domain-containing protein [Bradyrhizobium erythrophlei]SHI12047.1 FRG domain-containing protein [Bradyrhizobium erythrophlei]
MGIKIINVKTAEAAFDVLTKLAVPDRNIVFRGHRQDSWRLESTLARHVRKGASTELAIIGMDEAISHFLACLAEVGKLPSPPMNNRAKLEYARHHGVPSPLIDFSHSPYVALWMAFDGVRPWDDGATAIYALDVNALGILWRKHVGSGAAFDDFRWSERREQFTAGYDLNVLRYLEFPLSWNTRMLRQMGVFVYDALQYGHRDVPYRDLEDFIDKGIDSTLDDKPVTTLHKIIVPNSAASEVFERLELMGITGTRLYDNHEGAAADVKNSYVFNRRTGYAHDVIVPK